MIVVFHHFSHWLEGRSSPVLTITLLVLAAVFILVALFGNNLFRAILIADVLIP